MTQGFFLSGLFFKKFIVIFFIDKAIPRVFLISITLADVNSMTDINIYLGSFENHPCSSKCYLECFLPNVIWKKIETYIK